MKMMQQDDDEEVPALMCPEELFKGKYDLDLSERRKMISDIEKTNSLLLERLESLMREYARDLVRPAMHWTGQELLIRTNLSEQRAEQQRIKNAIITTKWQFRIHAHPSIQEMRQAMARSLESVIRANIEVNKYMDLQSLVKNKLQITEKDVKESIDEFIEEVKSVQETEDEAMKENATE